MNAKNQISLNTSTIGGSGIARPRPQSKLNPLSETNPFKGNELPPPVPSTPSNASLPLPCALDSNWSQSSVTTLADFDPLTMKTVN